MTAGPLRVVTEREAHPLDRDQAHATVEAHWRAARAAYSSAIGTIGDADLRELIMPGRRYSRRHIAAMRDRAQSLAHHATRAADELARAVEAFDRYDGSRP